MAMRTITIIVVVLALLTPFFLHQAGKGARHYLQTSQFHRLALSQVPTVWAGSGIKGRILLHCDRDIRLGDGGTDPSSMVGYGIQRNFFRTIYQVIPERSWKEVRSHLEARKNVVRTGRMFRVCMEGVSIWVLPMGDLPPMPEQVVLNINGDTWNREELAALATLLQQGKVKTDLMTITGTMTEDNAQLLRHAHDHQS